MSDTESPRAGASVPTTADLFREFDEKHGDALPVEEFTRPLTVAAVEIRRSHERALQCGATVMVRLAGSDRTHVGILLGDLPFGPEVLYSEKSQTLFVMDVSSPAIYVPELRRVVRGHEAQWTPSGEPCTSPG